mgnify:CR=1 FL=1
MATKNVRVSLSISYEKDGAKYHKNDVFEEDISGSGFTSGTQTIGTVREIVEHNTTDMGTLGWAFLKNVETTGLDYIEICKDDDDNDYHIRLGPGRACLVYLGTTNQIYAKTALGNQKLEYCLINY